MKIFIGIVIQSFSSSFANKGRVTLRKTLYEKIELRFPKFPFLLPKALLLSKIFSRFIESKLPFDFDLGFSTFSTG